MIFVIIDYHRQHDPDRGSLHHPGLQYLVRGDDQEVRELRGRHRERHRQGGGDRPQGVLHAGDGCDDHSDGDDDGDGDDGVVHADVHGAVRDLAELGHLGRAHRVRPPQALSISPAGKHQGKYILVS